MPKLVDLEVTVPKEGDFVYVPSSNSDGTAGFTLKGSTLDGNGYFNVGIRKVQPSQKSRKATLTYGDPLVTVCESTCSREDRGVIHFRLENLVAPSATFAERELAYDRFVTLLQHPDVRVAVVNNEPFFA